MLKLNRCAFALLIALPASAFAEVITVITHSDGTTAGDRTTLSALGIQVVDDSAQQYSLTVTTEYDTENLDSLPNGTQVSMLDAKVTVVLQFGAQYYQYLGTARAEAFVYSAFGNREGYQQNIDLAPSASVDGNYGFRITQWAFGAPGTFGNGEPLRPRDFYSADGAMLVNAIPVDPNDVEYYRITDANSNAAVVVTSPVPEPAPAALVAAGLAVLFWRRRRDSVRISSLCHG